jgi:TonB family protein
VQQKVTPTVTPGLNIQFTRFTDVESVTRPVVGPPSETQAPIEQEVIFEQGFNYQNYVDRLMRTLQRNWDPPAWQPSQKEGVYALICFTIRANGMVVNAYIETPSEWNELDESALRAVRQSSPVEPLPSEYGQPSVRAHVRFRPIRR